MNFELRTFNLCIMELDELKKSWKDYDKKLTDNLKLNEKLMKQLNLDKSKREMSKPLIYEIINVAVAFLVAVYMLGFALRHSGEGIFIAMSVMALAIDLVYLALGLVKLNRFYKIDYYNSSVVELQKSINNLKKMILQYRKIEMGLVPVFMLGIFPVVFKDFRDIDLFQNFKLYIIEMGAGMTIAFVLIIWINRQLYDKKLKNTEQFLHEIEEFEME